MHVGPRILLLDVTVIGAGLAGLVRLVNACVRDEAAVRARMGARLEVLDALEARDAAGQGAGPGRGTGMRTGRVQVHRREGRLEAWATCREGERTGEVRLVRWTGPEQP